MAKKIVIIDLSYHEDPSKINYDELCENVDGVILRVSYGKRVDTAFEKHYAEFTKRSVPLGAFIFLVEFNTAAEQVKVFIDKVKGKTFKLGYWCDVELENGAIPLTRKTVDEFMKIAEKTLGQIDIYTSAHYWDSIMKCDAYKTRKLWVANYAANHPYMPKTGGWILWWLWQYSANGVIPGYAGGIDMSHFWGTEEQYKSWIGDTTPVSETPLFNGKVVVGALNIRSEPVYKADGSNIVGQAYRDEVYPVYAISGDWLKINAGWVCEKSGTTVYVIRLSKTVQEQLDDHEKRIKALEAK